MEAARTSETWYLSTRLHSVTSQKIVFFENKLMSNLISTTSKAGILDAFID
jgi:hypothetical protein